MLIGYAPICIISWEFFTLIFIINLEILGLQSTVACISFMPLLSLFLVPFLLPLQVGHLANRRSFPCPNCLKWWGTLWGNLDRGASTNHRSKKEIKAKKKMDLGVVDWGARGSNQNLRSGRACKEPKKNYIRNTKKREYVGNVHLKPRYRLAKQ